MQSSLLDRIFPPSRPLLPQHDYRGSPPPSSKSPRPTTSPSSPLRQSSVTSRPAPVAASVIHHADPLLPVERAARSLQRTIQSLLDAQSEGLLAGLGSADIKDEVSSNGSVTPTPTMSSTTTRKPATMPIRQPVPKKISLRGARRGLSRSMHEFALLKQEEGRIIDTQIQEREDALGRVDVFTSKRNSLQSEIASISQEDPAQSADRLRSQATQLDAQIRQVEEELFEMKARHRQLVDQAEQLESSVQSNLSSYKASLDLLDKDIKRFLARPPIQQPTSATAVPQTDGREEDTASRSPKSFYALKSSRRTLEMASEHWQSEKAALQTRKSSIAREQSALEAGGKLWRQVVHQIQTLERHLNTQMQRLSSNLLSQQERDEGMVEVLEEMNKTMEMLKHSLKEAEENDWKLLLCCIGAEVEACTEGRAMLVEAFGQAGPNHGDKEAQNGLLVDDDAGEGSLSVELHSPDTVHMRQPAASASAAAAADEYVLDDWEGALTAGSTILFRPEGAAEVTARSSSPNKVEAVPMSMPVLGLARTTRADSRSEGEDDDPGPDFLISHT